MSDLQEDIEIPSDWRWRTLGDVCDDPQYGWTTSAAETGNVRLLRTSDITSGEVNWDEVPFCEEDPDDVDKYRLAAGDIVISRAGSVGFSHLVRNSQDAVFASYLIRFRPQINPRYVSYFLQTPMYWKSISEKKAGIAVQNVNATKLKQVAIPVPPTDQQRRIVSKLEELLSNLDAGLDSLQTAKRQLARYRKSVLQAAVEGQLTADWRRTHSPESADELLERILQERREQWEEDYREKYQSKCKKPPEGWRSRYSSPDGPENGNLPNIPTSWKWAKVEQISIVYSGVTKNASKSGDLVSMPYLRVANVYANELRLDDVGEIRVRRSRLYKYLLQEGDLLVVEGNGSKSQIGRIARWDGSIDPCVHQNHLIKVRPVIEACGRYLLLWMLSPAGRGHIMRVASSTSGLYTLSLTKVRNIPVPLPPLSEQREIVDEVSRLLSICDDVVNTLEGEEQRGKGLRQSILMQVFSGRLVPSGGETSADDASGVNRTSAIPMHVDE